VAGNVNHAAVKVLEEVLRRVIASVELNQNIGGCHRSRFVQGNRMQIEVLIGHIGYSGYMKRDSYTERIINSKKDETRRFSSKVLFELTPDQHELLKSCRTLDTSASAILRACIDKIANDPGLLEEIREIASAENGKRPISASTGHYAARLADFNAWRVEADEQEKLIRAMVSESAARDRIGVTSWIIRNLLVSADEGWEDVSILEREGETGRSTKSDE
jgi:hypothetical protein